MPESHPDRWRKIPSQSVLRRNEPLDQLVQGLMFLTWIRCLGGGVLCRRISLDGDEREKLPQPLGLERAHVAQ